MAEIRFVSDLGAEVSVPVTGSTPEELRQAVLRAQRAFGQLGWRCCPLPPGGFTFPLANEPDFDWRLLGARRGTCTVDGEERDGVWYAGQFYTRRALDPNPRMKLGRAIKYSRGARSTDPADVVEGEEGSSFRYVTLAVFRGEGRRREQYAVPRETTRQSTASHGGAAAEAPSARHRMPAAEPAR